MRSFERKSWSWRSRSATSSRITRTRRTFDEMTKTCIMHQILPETISQQILLQDSNKHKDLDYEEPKAGMLTFLATMPGGLLPMVANMEKENEYKHEDYGAHQKGDAWAGWQRHTWSGASGADWPEPYNAAAMYAKVQGKGKGFQGSCGNCGDGGHSQRFCTKGGGKGISKGGKGAKGKEKGKGKGMLSNNNKGKGKCHNCSEPGHFARECSGMGTDMDTTDTNLLSARCGPEEVRAWSSPSMNGSRCSAWRSSR